MGSGKGYASDAYRIARDQMSDPTYFANKLAYDKGEGYALGLRLAKERAGLKVGEWETGEQRDLAAMLKEAAMGRGESQAQAQLRLGLDQSIAQQLSAVAGASPMARLAMQRAAMMSGGQMSQQFANQSAQLRAQEIESARGQLGGVLSGMSSEATARQGLADAMARAYGEQGLSRDQSALSALLQQKAMDYQWKEALLGKADTRGKWDKYGAPIVGGLLGAGGQVAGGMAGNPNFFT